jgi:hypothetical protein
LLTIYRSAGSRAVHAGAVLSSDQIDQAAGIWADTVDTVVSR